MTDHLKNKETSNSVAHDAGLLVESVTEKLPFDKQAHLLSEIFKVVEKVTDETGQSEG